MPMTTQEIVEKLRKLKRKPEDWVFVPNLKKLKTAHVNIFNGETRNIVGENGDIRKETVKAGLAINVTQASKTKDGKIVGGYRPKDEGRFTAAEVLEAFIKMSLNPAAPVVPYEAREIPAGLKEVEIELASERAANQENERRLRELEGTNSKQAERLAELEKYFEDNTKPGKQK